MPIKIPATLPAHDVLKREGVQVMSEELADRQDIRPLQIGLLNLMPKKVQTETQFARLIGAGPLQIELTLIRMSDHVTRNTSQAHMEAFYQTFAEARGRKFDGLIITGAPIEHLPFEEVTYWDELREIFAWTQTHVHSTYAVCWGAQAMLNHFHDVPKHDLEAKAFGCFRHRNLAPASPYLRGFSDDFVVPVSRWTEIREDDLPAEFRAGRADAFGRSRPLPDPRPCASGALHVQPPRIRLDHAEGRIRPGCRSRWPDQPARELLPR